MFSSVRVGAKGASNTLIVGYFQGANLDTTTRQLDKDKSIAAALKRPEATGDVGSLVEAFPTGKNSVDRVLIVGLGEKKSLNAASLRNAAAAAGRRMAQIKETAAEVNLTGALKGTKVKPHDAGAAFGEGLGLLAWTCDHFRGKGTPDPKRSKLTIRADEAQFAKGLKRGLAIAESANLARTVSQSPPNICTTSFVMAEARKLAKQTGMTCTIIKGKQLEEQKLQGLINVGKASENEPCLIRLEYKPARAAKGSKPVVFVGKTITYDSGGLSLKINNGMKGMKRDMDGGCAVLGAMHAIATTIKPNRRVVALLPTAENSISDEAYRPDDVITFRNGVTVEVTNTDAEGRLVLADGLCWACEKENPEFIVDIATLTGGVVVALGSVYAGLWCDDDKLRKKVEAAADATGEAVWRLPHHEGYRAMMKSPVADIVNSAPVREAHPIQGAAFLSYFVGKDIPWAHIDIAGVHATDKDKGPFIPGPTGFGTRLLASLVGD